jgi:hypothetical protein
MQIRCHAYQIRERERKDDATIFNTFTPLLKMHRQFNGEEYISCSMVSSDLDSPSASPSSSPSQNGCNLKHIIS